jgi:hypothetical protein
MSGIEAKHAYALSAAPEIDEWNNAKTAQK